MVEHSAFDAFDANCTVGRHVYLTEDGRHTAQQLIEDMDQHGIVEALVVDSLSRQHHPLDGNRRVLEVCTHSERLHPAWAALPPGTDEQPPPHALVDAMREAGVGALFLFTGQYKFRLSDWCIDELAEAFAAAAVPVFINPNDIGAGVPSSWDETDWEDVVAFCRRWPELPVIVSEFRIRRSQRTIYRALDACPNLRLELSGYWLYRGIEYIVERWGADRLIYGSNWPALGQGLTLATVTCADISDDDKRLIAGGNLRRLLAASTGCVHGAGDSPRRDSPRCLPAPADDYLAFGRTGRRPDAICLDDCHGHLGARFSHYHIPGGEIDDTMAELDRFGVDRAIVFSFAGVGSDETYGNDTVAEAIGRYPDRLIGLATLNPHRGEADMIRELERCAPRGFAGIKLIAHYQGYPSDGPMIAVACRWAHERRQIILNHYWGPAEHLERLLEAYRSALYITGHTTLEYRELMKRHGNLYVCTCPLLEPRSCETYVDQIGADRMLFGSDLQDLPIAWGLGPVLFAHITREQKEMILGGNLRRLLADGQSKA